MIWVFNKKIGITSEVQDEVKQVRLESTDTIPKWLSGTLVRNGPVRVAVNGQSSAHPLDGLAMLHAFRFRDGQVDYTNQFLRTEDYKSVFEEGTLKYGGFATDPCRSIFKKFLTFLIPENELARHNANVNVAKIADAYVALTEVPLPVEFDLETLKTLGVLDYEDELPKSKCWESAHPHYDAAQKKTLNYLIKFGKKSFYVIYSIDDGSSKRKVISEVPVSTPSYMHSFSVTKNYIILTEYPFVVNPLDLILMKQAFIKNFRWRPELGTRFTIVNRLTGEIVGQYQTNPFFSFHHANAFEQDDFIHLDMVTYDDPKIIMNLEPDYHPTRLERFTLNLKTKNITCQPLLSDSCEFPRLNEAFDGHPYKFLYLAGQESIYRVNVATKEVLTWSEQGCSPGEPVFVPSPNSQSEEDGVILTVILDHDHQVSFLLILDGKIFKELGRAIAPHLIPNGLHGQFFN